MITGAADTVNAGNGDTLALYGNDLVVSGSNETIQVGAGDQVDITGSNDNIVGAGNDTIVVDGSSDAVNASSSTIDFTGTGDTGDTVYGSGDTGTGWNTEQPPTTDPFNPEPDPQPEPPPDPAPTDPGDGGGSGIAIAAQVNGLIHAMATFSAQPATNDFSPADDLEIHAAGRIAAPWMQSQFHPQLHAL